MFIFTSMYQDPTLTLTDYIYESAYEHTHTPPSRDPYPSATLLVVLLGAITSPNQSTYPRTCKLGSVKLALYALPKRKDAITYFSRLMGMKR